MADDPLLPMFSEVPDALWPDRPRYLMSYAYLNEAQVDLCRAENVDLVVDSGAFTTEASGKQMNHDAYLEWLAANRDAVTFALSYDVIGDHKASRVNHEKAEDEVGDLIKMVPTFHLGSPLDEMERLCKAYDFVSVGGAVPYALQVRQLLAAVGTIHRIAAEHGTKLHGLGMTGNRVMHAFPWWSVDSSRWTSCARFPRIALAARDGRIHEFRHGQPLGRMERALVEQYGGDPGIMTTPGWSLAGTVGADAAMERRRWSLHSAARSLMQAEAHKNGVSQTPMRVYLSGIAPVPEGTAGAIVRAHKAGSPYGHTIYKEAAVEMGRVS